MTKQDEAEKHKNLGNLYLSRGEFDNAIACYKRAIAVKPFYSDAFNNMGVAMQRQNRLSDASENYRKAIKINPIYASAYCNLGTVLSLQGDKAGAQQAYKQALVISPRSAQAHYNLGSLFLDAKKYKKAALSFKKALSIDPDYAKANNGLGEALEGMGELVEAVAFLNLALEKSQDVQIYFNLGTVLKNLGRNGDAASHFEHCIRLDPNYRDAYTNLIEIKKAVGDLSRIDELEKELKRLSAN